MENSFERGSEWRKWDLHVHTINSHLNNNYGNTSSKDFIEAIKNKNISVVGLTNYFKFSDDDYKLKKELEQVGIVTFFNLEIRLAYQNKEDQCCDLHILFSDKIDDSQIKKFLANLTVKVNGKEKKADELSSKEEYVSATVEFDYLLTQLMQESLGLQSNYLLGFLSRGHGNGRTSSQYESLAKECHFLIHSTERIENIQKDREFWLKEGKPLIQSSDAHSIETIGEKYTWIKADCSFDGFKQIMFEPQDRTSIENERPDFKEDKNVIEKVRFISPNKIFSDKDIHFNQNLNVIIGGKSSGKSMLLYSIANTLLPNVGDKLLYKEDEKTPKYTLKNLDADFDFEVTTLAGISQKISEREKNSNSIIPDITYIPQNELVKLAEPELNGRGESLNKLVRHLICEESESKQLYDDFINKVQQYDTNRNLMIDNYFGVIDVIQKLENELKTKPDRKVLETNINTNTIKVDELNKKSGLKEAEINKFKQIIERQALCRKNAEKITIDKNLTQSFLSSLKSELSVLKERKNVFLNDIGDKFSVYYEDKLGFLQDSIDQVDSLLSEIKLSSEFLVDDIANSKNIFLIESNLLIKEENELRDLLKPYFVNEDIQKQIKTLNDSISSDKKQLEEIELLSKAIEQKKQMQEDLKNSLFELYGHTYNEYVAIVNSLKNRTDELENDGLQINGVAQFNFEKFRKEILYFTDGRSASNRNYDILDESKTRIAKYEFEDIKEQIQKMFDDILSCKYIVNNKLTKRDIVKRLLDDYYYDYWEITYKEDRLGEMSTGKASFVILMLIIGLSKSKSPILIDQPEDNLDNRSVSENVISYLRKKKTERQIILVTHNANIVVNADSENVIVANQKGQNNKESSSPYKFDYINGSIENSFPYNSKETDLLKSMGIKEHVADIVEGGKDAFEKREKKYGFN